MVYSSHRYDEEFLAQAVFGSNHSLSYFDGRLSTSTAALAHGYDAVCCFVNDPLTAEVLKVLRDGGTRFVALRCAGFNNLDMEKAKELGFRVARVPAYSPHSVAEHTLGLILSLNRKIHKAYHRVRDNNFSLDGLMGFDLFGKTVGIVGTGAIGTCVARILLGMGCRVLMHDVRSNSDCEALGQYVPMRQLFQESDILTLHCPLMRETHHLVNSESIALAKRGVMLVNTSRGGLIDTKAVISGLKSGHIGGLAIDVYEEESQLFFYDRSEQVLQDDVFSGFSPSRMSW